jgi:hypothetical protein
MSRFYLDEHIGNELYLADKYELWTDKDRIIYNGYHRGDLWSIFRKYLLENRRFILNDIPDFDGIGRIPSPKTWMPSALGRVESSIHPGEDFYRGREGRYGIDNMGAPPSNLATAGRANPRGISFLYLATDRNTVVAELRPWKGACLSIVKGRMSDPLRVVDLTKAHFLTNPFAYSEEEDLYDLRDHLRFLVQLSQELSLPVDRSRADIDYLPTQYLSELIRHLGYDGMFYPSAMNSRGGKNLVIFDPSRFQRESVEYVSISNIRYTYEVEATGGRGS